MLLKKFILIIILINQIDYLFGKYTENYDIIKIDINNDTGHITNCKSDNLKLTLNDDIKINIKELYIQHCSIINLPNALFLRLNQLTTLELSDNHINNIEDYAFNGLKNLKSLNLIRNNISEIKSWSNNDMNTLISLDLRRNQIKNIHSRDFERFENLQKLNLAVNYIEMIPEDGTFRGMTHLKYLNLGKNLLKQISKYSFRGLIKLNHLALHYNQINDIDEYAFETNTHLKSLRLEGNRITTLDFMHILSLARLIHFNISYNMVESLDKFSFAKDFELKDLDISYNRIKKISEDTLSGLQSLEMLNASHNYLDEIHPQSFNELTSLKHLDISSNNLISFDKNPLNYTLQLEYLNISRNAIKEFDSKTFNKLHNLEILDLSGNQLYKDDFLNLQSNVKYLDLSNNQYKSLNMSVVYDIEYANLADNPWNCTWLLKELIRSPSSVYFGNNYTMESGSFSLTVPGINCHDGKIWKSLVVINRKTPDLEEEIIVSVSSQQPYNVPWPKVRMDRFDQKSVIIWLIILVVIVFTAVRVGKYFLDKSEEKAEEQRKLKAERLAQRDNEYVEITQINRNGESVNTLNGH